MQGGRWSQSETEGRTNFWFGWRIRMWEIYSGQSGGSPSQADGGSVKFRGKEMLGADQSGLKAYRRAVQMVFQMCGIPQFETYGGHHYPGTS